ncbi:unnamed protein product [Trichogramma brassicae]|uniref:Uncharacterized protein n=1 Tax=Trichogramma brassicae TaxID=86971 RepID=A0A6H5HWX4_9HYME|nr:unnamed protein product [Trichogramma brassicae]
MHVCYTTSTTRDLRRGTRTQPCGAATKIDKSISGHAYKNICAWNRRVSRDRYDDRQNYPARQPDPAWYLWNRNWILGARQLRT